MGEPGRVYRGIGSRVKMVPGYDYIGEFVAFNPVTGQRAWEYRSENGAAMTASALATASGIVFGGTAGSGRLASTATFRARRSPSRSTAASIAPSAPAAAPARPPRKPG